MRFVVAGKIIGVLSAGLEVVVKKRTNVSLHHAFIILFTIFGQMWLDCLPDFVAVLLVDVRLSEGSVRREEVVSDLLY